MTLNDNQPGYPIHFRGSIVDLDSEGKQPEGKTYSYEEKIKASENAIVSLKALGIIIDCKEVDA